jgi:hypothetical protein
MEDAEPWYSQRPNPNHPAQSSAENCATCSASRGALGSFGVLFVGKVPTALFVRKENRHIVVLFRRLLFLDEQFLYRNMIRF